MMRITKTATALAVVALGATLMLGGCGSTTVATGPAPNTVTAIGTGTGAATPDTAEFSIGVTASGASGKAAQDKASKTAAAIIAAVKAQGIDAKEIQSSQITLNPRYDSNGRPTSAADASQIITVKTKSIDKVGAILEAAAAAGATNVSGPQFSLSDSNAARLDAIDKAMTDAKARAEAMAKAAGRALGPVVSVTEAGTDQVGPLFDSARAGASKSVEVPVEAGEVEAASQLTVVFSLQ